MSGFSLNALLQGLDKDKEWGHQQAAQESISTEKEKEYCMWVKPTSAGWQWLGEQQSTPTLDILMPIEGARRRCRIRPDGAQLTYKQRVNNETVEENSDVGFAMALSFYADGFNSHLFRRIRLEASPELMGQGAKHWDIDIFHIVPQHPNLPDIQALNELSDTLRQSTAYGDLVKVELEVEKFFTDSIRDLIPFEVEAVYSSRPKDEETQVMLADYWDNVTSI
ncbi:hypothetical protein HOV30_gp207 [Erwinia phage Derbicus]|uniref:Uncharacterized protein n=1 Tax=Erwinia phage Derbicus TaxID=2530027 RepID=A0A482IJM5_9CAUD|nr:hypothetical protein HOV30_gp207 [Erwinia phage Derbicus]QBP07633.1 hypothetical protein DERBICUS_207 [Erwinia phage Derbicus]